ncbi:homocysteine S-methyltransferase family protein [Phaeobacter sp. B1627]|uniref:homocysteine S-methyltransferase family protein n=1 Tax=Phaeobacter sp. B1627 TaxID=2583809 RepID=UPI00111B399E|nr:homocysteine S-methyltransferase family protein [Phaeobacter sp. B1627]TNJ41019.1 homocysteine S-methyltransferase family protein [Phaeobacter sp. B1627]
MSGITLLDGSIGQELVRRKGDRATPLWSTSVMMDAPDLVGELHRDYFAAGATVATTNTYAVHRSRLERIGLEDQLAPLLDTALSQATEARADYPTARIAGALGPLLASYRPDLEPDPEVASEAFREIAGLMAPHVDIFLAETVSSVQEALGVLKGVCGQGKPVWIAFSVLDEDGTRLRSGEPVSEVLPLLRDFDVAACLINCSRPEAIAPALEILKQADIPFGAFANGFEGIAEAFLEDAPTVEALSRRTDLGPAAYADYAMTWVEMGATIVGGCCEVGPDHIAELARRLRAAGHTLI